MTREIEVSVIGNSAKDIKASFPGRVIPGAEFYDYDDKYKNNKTQFELPAKLPKNKIKEIQYIAIKAYKISNCRGLARVDFLLDRKLKSLYQRNKHFAWIHSHFHVSETLGNKRT